MYRKTLIAHNHSLLLSDAIEELTLCNSKVLDVVSHMTEYFFFVGCIIRVGERPKKVTPLIIILIAQVMRCGVSHQPVERN